MSSNPGQSLQSLLDTNLDQLMKLIDEESEKHDAEFLKKKNAGFILLEIEKNSKQHATEISNILLWIATHHPEILKDEAEELRDLSVKRLYFLKSWEFPDKLVPTDTLTTLLNSQICRNLKTFCGYVNSQVLSNFPENMCHIRLALGRHTEVRSIIEILKCRRHRHLSRSTEENVMIGSENISIHFRCREVDLKDLAPLPDIGPKVYISDVSDHDVAWVVQAATALQPNEDEPFIDTLHLPRSTLTAVGVEAIAKGLCDAGITLENFGVSSPNLGNESKDSSNSEDSSDGEDSSDSEDSSDFAEMISAKYNLEDCMVIFGDDEFFEFTDFADYLPDDSTTKDWERVLEEISHQRSEDDSDDEDSDDEDLPDDVVHMLKEMMHQLGGSRDELDHTSDDSDDEDLPDLLGGSSDELDHTSDDSDDEDLPDLLE